MCRIPALAAKAVLVFLPAVQNLSGLFQQRCSAPLPVECAAGLFLTEAEQSSTEKGHTGTSLLLLQNITKWPKHVVIVMKKGFSGPRVPSVEQSTITMNHRHHVGPGLSADSTSCCPHYILWPLKHFVDCLSAVKEISSEKGQNQPELVADRCRKSPGGCLSPSADD